MDELRRRQGTNSDGPAFDEDRAANSSNGPRAERATHHGPRLRQEGAPVKPRDAAALGAVAAAARDCRICAAQLPHEPRPVFRAAPTARLLIVGQAPGTRVHASGIPWDDRSGERLRGWLGLDKARFYDAARVAILPMGFCFPGQDEKGGDLPPRRDCAPAWHGRFLPLMPHIRLTLLVGAYAQAFYLGGRRQATLTQTVAAWRDYLPEFVVLPHPSWRNTAWLRRHPWFEAELLPELRRRVAPLLA